MGSINPEVYENLMDVGRLDRHIGHMARKVGADVNHRGQCGAQ